MQALDSARAISTEEKVAMVHPEWDDNRKQAEVELIKTENALPVNPLDGANEDEQVI